MKIAIKSFLWVSSAYDEPGVAAYQVDVVDTAQTMEEAAEIGGLARTRTLNVEQAVAEGFDLAAISQALNIDAIGARESSDAALIAMTAERDELTAQLAAALAARDDLAMQLAAALGEIARLQPPA